MSQELPTLEYSPVERVLPLTGLCLVPFVAFLIGFFNVNLTACLCGYQGWDSLPGNLMATGMAVGCFLRFRPRIDRIAAGVACVPCTVLLFLNVHNLLWSGHHPLFP